VSSLSLEEIRKELKKRYKKSTTWSKRIDRMDDGQIFAIWMRIVHVESQETKLPIK
jgi:hypothetical protein